MSANFPPFLYAIFVPVLAFFCLFPLLIVGLVAGGAWRFSRHADGKTAKRTNLTIIGFRRPARRPDPRATRVAANRARVQANRTRGAKLAPAAAKPAAPRLAPKPAPRRNPGVHTRLAYPSPDADRYKYIEGQFSEFIHH